MGIPGVQPIFAAILVAFGIAGWVQGGFTALWQPPVPAGLPGRAVLAAVCSGIALASGAGLLWRRTAPAAARLLLGWLLLWMLVADGRIIVLAPAHEGTYQNWGETAVLVAAAWALYARLATGWDRRWAGPAAGDSGLRIARVIYALALIAFGLSHFVYLELTAPLVPEWLRAPIFWSHVTGAAYLAAGVALLTGTCAGLAATLAAWQMGLITLLVWMPLALTGRLSEYQWGELFLSGALTAAASVVAESYHRLRRVPVAAAHSASGSTRRTQPGQSAEVCTAPAAAGRGAAVPETAKLQPHEHLPRDD